MKTYGWTEESHAQFMVCLNHVKVSRGPQTAIPQAHHYEGDNPVGCSCTLWTVNGQYLFGNKYCGELTEEQILKNVKTWLFYWCKAFWRPDNARFLAYAVDVPVLDATRTHFMIFSECHPAAEKLFLEVFRPIFQKKTRNAAHTPYLVVWNVFVAASEVDWKKMYELIKDVK